MSVPVLPFYGHNPNKDGNFLSNFYPSKYQIQTEQILDLVTDRVSAAQRQALLNEHPTLTFKWSEQGFMLVKCLVFLESDLAQNHEVFQQILSAKTPSVAKSLGRKIRGFDDTVWKQYREDAMFYNLLWKFSQNSYIAQRLIETGDTILAEATLGDRIWGIGLNVDDPRSQDPNQWRGLNLLGKALMKVREKLMGTGH